MSFCHKPTMRPIFILPYHIRNNGWQEKNALKFRALIITWIERRGRAVGRGMDKIPLDFYKKSVNLSLSYR